MREYRTINKSGWGDGPWQNEPDKVQWVDEATGLDCLIVRGPSGALCGYVGVPEGHPWYGIDYNACARSPRCEERWCGHSPESALQVHGGITFSDTCFEPSRNRFEEFKRQMDDCADEARKFPQGDAAERLRDRGHLVQDYDAWAQHMEATAICHIADDGRPDKVWWFGFDCAHSGDLCPKYATSYPDLSRYGYETYKRLDYVRRETTGLAEQLAVVGGAS